MKKNYVSLGAISVLSVLAVMPAMGYTWAHPDGIQSFETIDHDINFVLNNDNVNASAGIVTGTAMRNTVNGDVVLTLDGVTQNNEGIETNVYGSLFLPSTGGLLSVETLTGVPPTEEQSLLQQYIDGNVTVNILSGSEIAKSVVGVNFYTSPNGITKSGLSGKTTVNVVNSTVNESVRGTNFREAAEGIAGIEIGDVELNIKDSLIKEEVVAAGSHASAKNVVINIEGNSVIGYTALDSDTPKGDGQVLAGANRKGATVDSTVINLNTDGTIRIAGNVHAGSRYRGDSNEPNLNSVRGNATLNMFGGGTINVGGDLRAYRVGGATELNINNVTATVGGDVKEFQTINMDENAKLNISGTLLLTSDSVVNMALANSNTYSRLTVGTLDANGAKLNMTVKEAGTYNLVTSGTVATDFTWNLTNAFYDLSMEDGTVTATLKSADDIAADNNLSSETAVTFAGLSSSTSDTLNDLSVKMQEMLATGSDADKQAVEDAAAALNPEQSSVVQSTVASIQNTVSSLAANRMSLPAAGRSGGDVNLTAGGVWAQLLYNKTHMKNQFDSYTGGVAVGIDGTLNQDFVVGFGYAFNHSDVTPTSRNIDIDSSTIFLYGQYKPDDWYVNTVLNYTFSDYSEQGDVLGTPVTADYTTNAFGAQLMAGYDLVGGVTPELGLRYLHVNSSDYTNSLGIKDELESTDYLTGVIGAKYGATFVANGDTLLHPEVHAAFKYDLISDGSSAVVTMPGVAAYTLNGDSLSRAGGEFGIGLTLTQQSVDISLTYDLEVRKDYTSHTGMLKARYNF